MESYNYTSATVQLERAAGVPFQRTQVCFEGVWKRDLQRGWWGFLRCDRCSKHWGPDWLGSFADKALRHFAMGNRCTFRGKPKGNDLPGWILCPTRGCFAGFNAQER